MHLKNFGLKSAHLEKHPAARPAIPPPIIRTEGTIGERWTKIDK